MGALQDTAENYTLDKSKPFTISRGLGVPIKYVQEGKIFNAAGDYIKDVEGYVPPKKERKQKEVQPEPQIRGRQGVINPPKPKFKPPKNEGTVKADALARAAEKLGQGTLPSEVREAQAENRKAENAERLAE